eukprot:23694-Amphidinium_carterae.1
MWAECYTLLTVRADHAHNYVHKAGADPRIKQRSGETPYDLAGTAHSDAHVVAPRALARPKPCDVVLASVTCCCQQFPEAQMRLDHSCKPGMWPRLMPSWKLGRNLSRC